MYLNRIFTSILAQSQNNMSRKDGRNYMFFSTILRALNILNVIEKKVKLKLKLKKNSA